jgi:hypothetical protein
VTDLGGVLDEVVRIAKTHVAAPETHFDTAALWCVHAHLVHRENLGVNITPRLAPQSPEEDSGKTTLLKIFRALVPRPKGVGSLMFPRTSSTASPTIGATCFRSPRLPEERGRSVCALRPELGDVEKQENRGAGGLLGAIWGIFADEAIDPRRMRTQDLIMKLLDLDEVRWRVANRGKPVDEWYLRTKLRDYVLKKTEGKEMPPRQWRSPSSAVPKKGYHELHFEDAFERYLGKGLPSATPAEAKPADNGESSKPSLLLYPPWIRYIRYRGRNA